MQNRRIEWVDIFKAIAIILVVIGHATGKYNMYIYQFHMAAFFFISGYTTNFRSRSFLKTCWIKFCSMILSIISIFFCGIILLSILDKLGIYSILFKDPYVSGISAIREFFMHGNNNVIWMGATWFVIILFQINIMHKILYDICGESSNWIHVISSITLFILGYYFVNHGINIKVSLFTIDLMLIGQFYFYLGQLCKSYSVIESKFNNFKINIIFFFVAVFILYVFKDYTVDYPSRKFGPIIINVLSSINGIIFVYTVSLFFSKINRLKEILKYIGNNTMGILLFHFMFFKIAYLILIILNIIPLDYMKNFTPTTEVGNKYWLMIVSISIICSLILWRVLLKVNILSLLLGQEKVLYENFYTNICANSILIKSYAFITNIRQTIIKFCIILKSLIVKNRKIAIIVSVIAILVCIPIVNHFSIMNLKIGNTLDTANIIEGYYSDGWIGKDMEFEIRTKKEGKIILTGYYPQKLTGDEQCTIYINDYKTMNYNINNQNFIIELNANHDSLVKIRIENNFSIKNTGKDIRQLSFILSNAVGE